MFTDAHPGIACFITPSMWFYSLAIRQTITPCPVSSTQKTDRHDLTELLLKVVLSTINQTNHQINQ
jgi:hypothetical protein